MSSSINLTNSIGPPPSLDSVSSGSRAFPSQTSIASNSTHTTIAKNPTARTNMRHLNRGPVPQHDPTENIEQLRIRQSFSQSSFLSLRSLPSNLKAGNITKALTKKKAKKRDESDGVMGHGVHVARGMMGYNAPNIQPKYFSQKMNLFSHTSYMESDYNIKSDKNKAEVKMNKAKQKKISGSAFKPGGNRRLLKHESISAAGHDEPFPYSSSPYDESREYWYKVKKMEDAKILAGSFRGSTQKLNSNKISYLPEVVKLLFKEIKEDWETSNFQASTIDDDRRPHQEKVLFRFQKNSVDSLSALNNYMTVMAETNENVKRGHLQREIGMWGVEDTGGWIEFCFYIADI
mmetsp:Transcript_4781/g.9589  ORF Transcript_4781/g.9589 Transcript_4781/m.9589 type:complete len:347 (+) Transcript_4781:4-1044(+)